MQPLKVLNNVQKARLIHALFPQEIPAFLAYTAELCRFMKDHPDEVRESWQTQLFGVDFWFGLAEDAARKIRQYGRQLERSSSLFADQLFDGYGAVYLHHCLNAYTGNGRHRDPKFKLAVDLFFNP